MKKGYKRLLIFEVIITFILIVNSFFVSFLSNLGMCIFLFTIFIVFKYLFGFEKTQQRYIKDIILEITIFLISFLLIYYLLGIFIGFTSSMNAITLVEKLKLIALLSISIIIKEYLRCMMLRKSDLNKNTTIATIILFIFIDISTSIAYGDFSDNYSIFKFIAMIIMPAISANISYSYVAKKIGYKPVIFYCLIITLYPYIIPIIPNVNSYIYSLISLLLPCAFMLVVYRFFKKSDDNDEKEREYHKKKYTYIKMIPIFAIVFLLIFLYSGYCRFWVIAIATGSMTPKISVGDLVVVDQKTDKTKLKEGQVIAYKNNNTIVVHRIKGIIISKKEKHYITKGDANKKPDAIIVKEDMILGKVETKIPYLGLPTVWLHEMLN